MIRKVFLGAVLWSILISYLHVQLNVGWGELMQRIKAHFGEQRRELVVGFLPVT